MDAILRGILGFSPGNLDGQRHARVGSEQPSQTVERRVDERARHHLGQPSMGSQRRVSTDLSRDERHAQVGIGNQEADTIGRSLIGYERAPIRRDEEEVDLREFTERKEDERARNDLGLSSSGLRRRVSADLSRDERHAQVGTGNQAAQAVGRSVIGHERALIRRYEAGVNLRGASRNSGASELDDPRRSVNSPRNAAVGSGDGRN